MMFPSLLLISCIAVLTTADSVTFEQPSDFKSNCFLSAGNGCKCAVVEDFSDCEGCVCTVAYNITFVEYDDHYLCRLYPSDQVANKFGDFKEKCYPNPSGGCNCMVDLGRGVDEIKVYSEAINCSKSIVVDLPDKKELKEEIKKNFGAFKENCFPKPGGGCNCREKDGEGNEVVASYDDAAECLARGDARVKRSNDAPSQNVGDPVRERAHANYAAVVEELNKKFKGLKEGCYPRPKGCLCVIGKTSEGRDITERRIKDVDCKCQPGERGPACPGA